MNNQVTKICNNAQQRINDSVKHLDVLKRVEEFGDDFEEEQAVNSMKIFAESIQLSTIRMYETYGTMSMNFDLASTIIQWKPTVIPEGAKKLWELIEANCKQICEHQMKTIRMGAKYRESLISLYAGMSDFVQRSKLKEPMMSAMQGLKSQLAKFGEFEKEFGDFVKTAQQDCETSLNKVFEGAVNWEEQKSIMTNIIKENELMNKIEKEKRAIENEVLKNTDQKLYELLEELGKLEGAKNACEMEINIADKSIQNQEQALEWAQKKQQEFHEKAASSLNYHTETKSTTISNTSGWWLWKSSTSTTSMEPTKTDTGEKTKWEKELAKMKNELNDYDSKKSKCEQNKKSNLAELDQLKRSIEAKK